MCLSPAPAAALRWLAATPRAQLVARRAPCPQPRRPPGHGWVCGPWHWEGSPTAIPRSSIAKIVAAQWLTRKRKFRLLALSAWKTPRGGSEQFAFSLAKVHLLYRLQKFLIKGWGKGWRIKGQTVEVSLQAQLSPRSEPDVLPQLEAVPFLGRRARAGPCRKANSTSHSGKKYF